jgi:hypothetical protein
MAMKNTQSVKRLSSVIRRRLFGTARAVATLAGEFRSRSSTEIIVANRIVTREFRTAKQRKSFGDIPLFVVH